MENVQLRKMSDT